MRKKYNEINNTKIGNYFTRLILIRYILPSIVVLLFIFMGVLLIIDQLSTTIFEFTAINCLYLLCMNILVSIASTSIYHIIKTCLFGYNQILSKQYIVLELTCKEKSKGFLKDTCVLSDNKKYTLYDRKQYNEIQVGELCDLIIISNEYGAKLWEIAIRAHKN